VPTIANGEAEIYYEEHGTGFPILAFAPGGVPHSKIAVWGTPMVPIDAIAEWSNGYRVIVMDQRNTLGGRSRAPITAGDGWDSYTSDHIALLDHLKIDRCFLFGQCIGGSFIANLLKQQPERVAGAIWAQPIGRAGAAEPAGTPTSRSGRKASPIARRSRSRCWRRSIAISTRRVFSTARTAKT
jgi:pimeloyl-ACP methyl ester carboxylesterase